MKKILKRVFYEYKGRPKKTVVNILFFAVLGFAFSVVLGFLSFSQSHINSLNNEFPPTLFLNSKEAYQNEDFVLNPPEAVMNILEQYENVNSDIPFRNEHSMYIFTLYRHQDIDKTVEELSALLKDTSYYVVSSFDSTTILVETMFLAIEMQRIILVIILACLFAFFVSLNILNIKYSLIDFAILKKLGETKFDIAKQYIFSLVFSSYLPFIITSLIGFMSYDYFSEMWTGEMIAQTVDNTSYVVNFSEHSTLMLQNTTHYSAITLAFVVFGMTSLNFALFFISTYLLGKRKKSSKVV